VHFDAAVLDVASYIEKAMSDAFISAISRRDLRQVVRLGIGHVAPQADRRRFARRRGRPGRWPRQGSGKHGNAGQAARPSIIAGMVGRSWRTCPFVLVFGKDVVDRSEEN